jgi:hypothetical protein
MKMETVEEKIARLTHELDELRRQTNAKPLTHIQVIEYEIAKDCFLCTHAMAKRCFKDQVVACERDNYHVRAAVATPILLPQLITKKKSMTYSFEKGQKVALECLCSLTSSGEKSFVSEQSARKLFEKATGIRFLYGEIQKLPNRAVASMSRTERMPLLRISGICQLKVVGRVMDPETLLQAIAKGIGGRRSYGYGYIHVVGKWLDSEFQPTYGCRVYENDKEINDERTDCAEG